MRNWRNSNIRITKKCVINSVSNIIICTFMFNIGFIIANTILAFDNTIIQIYEYLSLKI